MKRAIVALLLVCTTIAHAGPRQVLVLKAEGTADGNSRAAIESHVLRIAKQTEGKVEQGNITLSDAAAAAGCTVADAGCKDEILATFAVDEIVATTVSYAPLGQVTVTVRRLQKNTAPKAAASTVTVNRSAGTTLDQDIGPLFTGVAPPPPDRTPPPPPTVTTPPPPTTTEPAMAPTEPPVTTDTSQPLNPYVEPQPATDTAPNRKWQKIGIGVGAGLVLLSFVMWTSASGKQEEIDNAPHDTPADFQRLSELESEADGLAGGGNLFFIGGVVLAGISGYYYWKKGRAARTQSARITPTVFSGGAGVVLSVGGGL